MNIFPLTKYTKLTVALAGLLFATLLPLGVSGEANAALSTAQKEQCFLKYTGQEWSFVTQALLNAVPGEGKWDLCDKEKGGICQDVGGTIGCIDPASGNLLTRIPTKRGAGGDCAARTDLSFSWGGTGDCATTSSLISTVFKVLAALVGITVVIGIAWGGMLYATSNGNAAKSQQGITFIVNSVIGLILFIFMFAISNFIVPGGVLG